MHINSSLVNKKIDVYFVKCLISLKAFTWIRIKRISIRSFGFPLDIFLHMFDESGDWYLFVSSSAVGWRLVVAGWSSWGLLLSLRWFCWITKWLWFQIKNMELRVFYNPSLYDSRSKGKGKGISAAWEAWRPLKEAVSCLNSLPLPFRTHATQAVMNPSTFLSPRETYFHVMHLSVLNWRGRPGMSRGFDKGNQPVVATFEYRRVTGIGDFWIFPAHRCHFGSQRWWP